MTVRDAERLARLALGSRIDVDRTAHGWVIEQWGLTDAGYKQTRTIGQHKDWDTCFRQARQHHRTPWNLPTVATVSILNPSREDA